MSTPTERQKRFEEKFLGGNPATVISGERYFNPDVEKVLAHMESEVEKVVREERNRIADTLKDHFNGFRGTLGFTLHEILALLNPTDHD